jgi:predicted SnoaL-like aldol condensation-catalyzing enzyme
MKNTLFLLLSMVIQVYGYCQQDSLRFKNLSDANKEIARNFYQDLWFTNNTDKYVDYVAKEYVVHDTWDRKNITEPAIEQKNIADMFWKNGDLTGVIDYQIAEGDLVATRWHASLEPKTLFGRVLGMENLGIINVFRIKDGKIVEIWNHRHDIETSQTLEFVFKGLLIGLLIALIPTIVAFRLKRKLKAIIK